MCSFLEEKGYSHYEISNFCKEGYEGRHNLKYWQGLPYLGLGPSAHSFLNGERFYYPRDIKGYVASPSPISDGFGGDCEEFIMLALRLKSGIVFNEYERRFGRPLSQDFIKKCRLFEKQGLAVCDHNHVALTAQGLLLSNTIISNLLE